ncbi:MAG: PorV/PorQ family protein [Candidatus Krumholzibacteriia bacterium]|nr:PorV/PorQ family protein [Candidatus Latescibacterota bacterium]
MNTTSIRILVLSALLLAAASPSAAQDASGGQPGTFLRFGASARGLAMGGASTGLANDASALFYNPAGMEQVRSTELLFFHAELLAETRYQYLGLVQPLGHFGTLGVAGALLSSGGFERSSLLEDTGESFDETQNSLQVSFARRFGSVSLAASYRTVNQSLAGYSGSGSGLDLAVFNRPARHFSFGFLVQNVLAPEITLLQTAESYPLTVRAGGALHLRDGRVLSTLDLVRVGDAPLGVQTGIEVWGLGNFALRSGWDTMRNGYAAGGGYRSGAWQLDYAVSDTPIGLSHRLSFTWRFGVPLGVSLSSDTARFSPSGERNRVELELKSQFRGKAKGWELVIYDNDGQPRHSARGSKEPPETYSWDGRDDQGRLVSTGSYRVVVVVLDEFGDPWTQELNVEIRDYDPALKTPVQLEVN